jgi:hypothetical protein
MDNFFPGNLTSPLFRGNQFALWFIQRRRFGNFAIPISNFLLPIK